MEDDCRADLRLAWENTPTTPPYDLNNTTPLQVLENQPVGTLVGQFTAEDPDLLHPDLHPGRRIQ